MIQRTQATRPKPTAGSEPQTVGTGRLLSKLQLPKRRKRWEHFTKKFLFCQQRTEDLNESVSFLVIKFMII